MKSRLKFIFLSHLHFWTGSNYELAIKFGPYFDRAHLNRAVSYSMQGKIKEALDDYAEAIQKNPTFYEAFMNRGGLYVDIHEFDSAIKDFRKGISIEPNIAIAYIHLGNAFYLQERYDLAISEYSIAIKKSKKQPDPVLYNRGLAYKKMGKKNQAKNDFEEFIKFYESDPSLETQILRARELLEEMK